MARERVPLYPEEEEHHDEPVTTPAEELREGIDRSGYTEDREDGERGDIEEKAVQRLVEKLREKGKSEEFIQAHMDDIRERVRQELSQDRR